MIVVDASLVIALVLREDNVDNHALVYDALRSDLITVPAHWPAEIANALWANQRRGRIPANTLNAIVEYLMAFNPRIEAAPPLERTAFLVQLAEAEKLTVYDAIYIQLALACNASLATVDREMRACARRFDIPLLPA